jgi:hypothetical protein
MKSFSFLTLIVLPLLLTFTSCELLEQDGNVISEPNHYIQTYPLAIENEWVYERYRIGEIFNAEKQEYTIDTAKITTVVTRVEKDTILDGNIHVKKLTTYESESQLHDVTYVAIVDNKLITYAYAGYGNGIFAFAKTGSSNNLFLLPFTYQPPSGKAYKEQNSIYFLDPPVINLKFPIKVGQQWIFQSLHDEVIHKKVKTKEKLETKAGIFTCAQLTYHADFIDPEDFETIDYVANEGLIKRTIKESKHYFRDHHGNQIEDYYRTYDHYYLKEYNIKP